MTTCQEDAYGTGLAYCWTTNGFHIIRFFNQIKNKDSSTIISLSFFLSSWPQHFSNSFPQNTFLSISEIFFLWWSIKTWKQFSDSIKKNFGDKHFHHSREQQKIKLLPNLRRNKNSGKKFLRRSFRCRRIWFLLRSLISVGSEKFLGSEKFGRI